MGCVMEQVGCMRMAYFSPEPGKMIFCTAKAQWNCQMAQNMMECGMITILTVQ